MRGLYRRPLIPAQAQAGIQAFSAYMSSCVPAFRGNERPVAITAARIPPISLRRDDDRPLRVLRHLSELRFEPVFEHAINAVEIDVDDRRDE